MRVRVQVRCGEAELHRNSLDQRASILICSGERNSGSPPGSPLLSVPFVWMNIPDGHVLHEMRNRRRRMKKLTTPCGELVPARLLSALSPCRMHTAEKDAGCSTLGGQCGEVANVAVRELEKTGARKATKGETAIRGASQGAGTRGPEYNPKPTSTPSHCRSEVTYLRFPILPAPQKAQLHCRYLWDDPRPMSSLALYLRSWPQGTPLSQPPSAVP